MFRLWNARRSLGLILQETSRMPLRRSIKWPELLTLRLMAAPAPGAATSPPERRRP